MGARGPKKQPTELALVKGETRPSRVNYDEPEAPPEVPDPPEYLNLDALGVWQRLAPTLHGRGVLTVWDVDAFAAFCTAVVIHRRAVQIVNDGNIIHRGAKHPALQVVRDQAAQIIALGARFGLTPSDRASIRAGDLNAPGSGGGGGILD